MIDSRDKEVIKTIQAKTQIINKLEDKASKVLVLQFGSYSIKMGFANQKVPFTIKPYIAYRKSNQAIEQKKKQKEDENRFQEQVDIVAFKKQYSQIEGYLKSEGIITSQHRPVKGKPRGKQNIPLTYWPQPSTQQILYSEQALAVQDSKQYNFRKPIRHGQLNIKQNTTLEITQCLNDLQRLLRYMLKQKMKIPQKQWKTFSCILVLPDVFIRQHVKMLVTMIFSQIQFARMYLHLESVLACLGMAISSAVVVDIGHEKINVCCIEQGVILPKTLIRKNYGLKHISKTMIKLFNSKINEQGYDLHTNSQSDIQQVDQIKQLGCCVREPQQNSNKVYQLKTYRMMKPIQISINYNDVLCIGANSIFFTIWNCFPIQKILYREAFDCYSQLYDLQYDPDDMFEEFSGGGHVLEIEEDSVYYGRDIANPYLYQSLSDIVAASIWSIKDPQARKKFLTNIFIIGGGGLMPQLSEQLLSRLNKIFETADSEQKAESAADLYGKQIDMSHASWLGGTVLPKLDSLRDLWIERAKYLGDIKQEALDPEEEGVLDKKLFTRKQQSQEWGLRYLKQKIPFLW